MSSVEREYRNSVLSYYAGRLLHAVEFRLLVRPCYRLLAISSVSFFISRAEFRGRFRGMRQATTIVAYFRDLADSEGCAELSRDLITP